MKKRVLSLMLATVMCMALAVTANAVEYDSSMVNLGERAGSVLSVEQTSLINGNFPKNVRGETYGTALMAEVVGEMPDLQAAIGTNDQEGYVRTSDLSHPKFETPQDALEWQKTQPDSYYIPLYDFQGNEIGRANEISHKSGFRFEIDFLGCAYLMNDAVFQYYNSVGHGKCF